MVRVQRNATKNASDSTTAWRIRDAMATHPLLGGATAQIDVIVAYECVILEGWTLDEGLIDVAGRIARRVVGNRSLENRIRAGAFKRTPCAGVVTQTQP